MDPSYLTIVSNHTDHPIKMVSAQSVLVSSSLSNDENIYIVDIVKEYPYPGVLCSTYSGPTTCPCDYH